MSLGPFERARIRWRAGVLLARAVRGAAGPGDPRVRVARLESRSGLACDVFEPTGARQATVVALHGVTLNGKDDGRLQAFGRALAASGLRCFAPALPGLSRLQWTPEDPVRIASLLEEIRSKEGASAGLIGFSFGGSCALVAAAMAGRSARFALTVGAYHSLPALYDELHAARGELLGGGRGRESLLYVALVMAWRNADALGLDSSKSQELERLLRSACDAGVAREELAFYERHLAALDPVGFEYRRRDLDALAAASPAGKLAGITCPVALLHDAEDSLILPSHARALAGELQRLPNRPEHQVLITPLLSHVGLGDLGKLRDLPALLDCFALLQAL